MRRILAPLMIGVLAFTLVLAVRGEAAEHGSGLDVQVEGGRLSVALETVPLADVLEAIGEQSGVEIKVFGDPGAVRPQQFEGVPLAQGIRRLVGDNALVMVHGAGGEGVSGLQAVRVYGAGGGPARDAAADGRRDRRSATGERQGGGQRLSGRAAAAERERTAGLERVRELARARDPAAVPELAELLAGDADASTRRLAANALAGTGGEEAVEALRAALDDRDRAVRSQALRGLHGLMGEAVVPVLADVIEGHADAALRRSAVEIAAGMGSDEARAVIERALEDRDETVRSTAERIVAR